MRSAVKNMVRGCLKPLDVSLGRLSQQPSFGTIGLTNFPIRTIFDIGASRGRFAEEIMPEFPDAVVYCCEPLPRAFGDLEDRAARHDGRMRTVRTAVGDRAGTAAMFEHVEHTPSSSILKTTATSHDLFPFTRAQKKVEVPITTLDALVAGLADEAPDDWLIKLDVQGYEEHVIRGGRAALGRARACVVEASLDGLYDGQPTFKDLVVAFENLGLSYAGNLFQNFAAAPEPHVVYVDALFLRRG